MATMIQLNNGGTGIIDEDGVFVFINNKFYDVGAEGACTMLNLYDIPQRGISQALEHLDRWTRQELRSRPHDYPEDIWDEWEMPIKYQQILAWCFV